MANTGAIRNRMKSIRQTVQISNAQKLIAASRIGKAKRMLAEAAPFHERIRVTIADVLSGCPDVASPYLERSDTKLERRGVLVITSDKGLAGGYNGNVVKLSDESLRSHPAAHLIVLGNVGRRQLASAGFGSSLEMEYATDPPNLFAAREIADEIMRLFEEGVVDNFDVVYTHYASSVRLEPRMERLFPLPGKAFGDPSIPPKNVEFEPHPEVLLAVLLSKYVKGFVYGCLVHAWASELASRIAAMDSAIRNGNEMLDELSLLYNRARQAAITQEITEIVSGAASMEE